MRNPDHEHNPLEDYFTALDAGRFEEALATLADSCVYIRPPVSSVVGRPSVGVETYTGKESVRAFLEKRGKLPVEHDIHASTTDGGQCFVMGTAMLVVPSHTEHSIFMAHALVDKTGRITRFLAISSAIDAAAATGITSPG